MRTMKGNTLRFRLTEGCCVYKLKNKTYKLMQLHALQWIAYFTYKEYNTTRYAIVKQHGACGATATTLKTTVFYFSKTTAVYKRFECGGFLSLYMLLMVLTAGKRLPLGVLPSWISQAQLKQCVTKCNTHQIFVLLLTLFWLFISNYDNQAHVWKVWSC